MRKLLAIIAALAVLITTSASTASAAETFVYERTTTSFRAEFEPSYAFCHWYSLALEVREVIERQPPAPATTLREISARLIAWHSCGEPLGPYQDAMAVGTAPLRAGQFHVAEDLGKATISAVIPMTEVPITPHPYQHPVVFGSFSFVVDLTFDGGTPSITRTSSHEHSPDLTLQRWESTGFWTPGTTTGTIDSSRDTLEYADGAPKFGGLTTSDIRIVRISR
jgi:hypothetical protein